MSSSLSFAASRNLITAGTAGRHSNSNLQQPVKLDECIFERSQKVCFWIMESKLSIYEPRILEHLIFYSCVDDNGSTQCWFNTNLHVRLLYSYNFQNKKYRWHSEIPCKALAITAVAFDSLRNLLRLRVNINVRTSHQANKSVA